MYLWRAVGAEGEILDALVQSKRDRRAALRLMRFFFLAPTRLRSVSSVCPASMSEASVRTNRAESSHVPIRRRERKMQGFRSAGSAECFLAIHAAVANTFTTCRHLVTAKTHRLLRNEAFAAWQQAVGLLA